VGGLLRQDSRPESQARCHTKVSSACFISATQQHHSAKIHFAGRSGGESRLLGHPDGSTEVSLRNRIAAEQLLCHRNSRILGWSILQHAPVHDKRLDDETIKTKAGTQDPRAARDPCLRLPRARLSRGYPKTQQAPASPPRRDDGYVSRQCRKARNGASATSRRNRACMGGILSARLPNLTATGVLPKPPTQKPS